MRIIARNKLRAFWEKHPDSEEALKAWVKVTKGPDWKNPQEVKVCYGNASILKDGRVVFNISGNKYRLIALINVESVTPQNMQIFQMQTMLIMTFTLKIRMAIGLMSKFGEINLMDMMSNIIARRENQKKSLMKKISAL